MQIANRLKRIPPYLFMELRNKINKAKAEGIDVISLAVGIRLNQRPNRSLTHSIDRLQKQLTTVIQRTKKKECLRIGKPSQIGIRPDTTLI